MGMQLPGDMRKALEMCGFNWPSTDESVLGRWGEEWAQLSTSATTSAGDIETNIANIAANNSGPATSAFTSYMRSQEANMASLFDFASACSKVGTACGVADKIVVTMKLAVIVQLGLIVAALAATFLTAGLAAFAVALVREGAKRLINVAIDLAISEIMMS